MNSICFAIAKPLTICNSLTILVLALVLIMATIEIRINSLRMVELNVAF
jgi:hypothetical protein